MALWLGRLFRRGERRDEPDDSDGYGSAAVALAADEGQPRFSVWDRLAGDPAAQALRAQWESRWDEF